MATKRLGRTVIECGRGGYSQSNRKLLNRAKRKFKLEDGEYEPSKLPSRSVELRDSLNALERWLRSHVGKLWSKVYSEFCAKEDKRSLRGEHIHRHMKQMVRGAGGREYCHPIRYYGRSTPPCRVYLHDYTGFWVDDKGFLREHRRYADCLAFSKRTWGWLPPPPEAPPLYFNGRYVGPPHTLKDLLAKEQQQRISSGVITHNDLQEVLRRMQERKQTY